MIERNAPTNYEEGLAEQCRLALEKSYGMKIPVPKHLAKARKRLEGKDFDV